MTVPPSSLVTLAASVLSCAWSAASPFVRFVVSVPMAGSDGTVTDWPGMLMVVMRLRLHNRDDSEDHCGDRSKPAESGHHPKSGIVGRVVATGSALS